MMYLYKFTCTNVISNPHKKIKTVTLHKIFSLFNLHKTTSAIIPRITMTTITIQQASFQFLLCVCFLKSVALSKNRVLFSARFSEKKGNMRNNYAYSVWLCTLHSAGCCWNFYLRSFYFKMLKFVLWAFTLDFYTQNVRFAWWTIDTWFENVSCQFVCEFLFLF